MADQYLLRDGNTDPINSIDILDFDEIDIGKSELIYKESNGKQKISSTLAAGALMTHYEIYASEGSDSFGRVWIYNAKKGIYTPNGVTIIKYILQELGQDLSTTYVENQVINRICAHRCIKMSAFDPDPYMLCVRNGVIDLRTGEFLKHDPKYMMTIRLDVEYDPKAKCLKFDKFLDDIVEKPEDKNTIYDFVAATLIKKPFDILLTLVGGGRNGKGRLILFMRWFLGNENVTSFRVDKLGSRFASINVFRKLAMINGEVEGYLPMNAIKDVVSGNPVNIEIKNGGFFDFEPYVKVIFDTNNPPKIKDTSEGRIRRHYKLDFPNRFVDEPDPNNPCEKKKDPNILDKLKTEEEKSGLLNELIKRASELIEGRPIYRRKSEQETANEYEAQTHSISEFIETWCELEVSEYDERLHCKSPLSTMTYAEDLYTAYSIFCKSINTPPKTQKALAGYLKDLGYKSMHEGERRRRAYKGIQLTELAKSIINMNIVAQRTEPLKSTA